MSKHTPGPWAAVDDPQDGSAENWYIITDKEDVLSLGLSEPDARLIAAAPDLLKLVKDIANLDHYCLAHGDKTLINDLRAWKKEARAAIAKAEDDQ